MQLSIVGQTAFVALMAILVLLNVERAYTLPEQQATPASQQASLSAGEIDQLVAPVALYPDPLLANVLIGSTYPLEVVKAARFVQGNRALSGDKLRESLAQQGWDDSVKALVYAPAVLAIMSKQIDWTNKLGEAFLAQQNDIFDAVQRLRKQAVEAGQLQGTAQQTVTVEDGTIYIEPTETTTMYVPYYDSNDAYGLWLWDDYPPYHWPPPPNYGVVKGFFVAAIIAGAWNGSINYPSHHLTINNRVEHFSRRGATDGEVWRHNPSHRQGMNYSRPELQGKYGTRKLVGDTARSDFRGHSRTTGQVSRGGNWEAWQRSSGFDGMGHGNDTRGYSDRGYSSRTRSIGGFSGYRAGGGFRGSGGRR
jgi:hypothetical protein